MRGEMIYLYAFDVANEIVTADVREILASQSFPFTLNGDHTYPKEVPLHQPLTIEPPQPEARVGGQPVRVVIRVFEVGVVSVALRMPFTAARLADLMAWHHPLLDSGETFDEWARRLCLDVCDSIRPFLVRSSPPSTPEAYTVFLLTDLDGEQDATAWFARERRRVAGLLTEIAPDRLAESQVEEAVRVRQAFANTDLVVIDWDASLVVELDGDADDVLYVLELANLQLEELRVMDQRLDRHLDRVYGDLERRQSMWLGMPTRMLVWLRRFRMDAAKLTEEVTNITKFFGDWYLARVYLGVQERFHLQQWRQSVEHRLGQLDEIYRVLHAGIYERRMLWLEVAIVICFLVDLYAIFFWK